MMIGYWKKFGWSAPDQWAQEQGTPADVVRVAAVRAKFELVEETIRLLCQDSFGRRLAVDEALAAAERAVFNLSTAVAAATVWGEGDE